MTLPAIQRQRDQLDDLFDLMDGLQRGQFGHLPPSTLFSIAARMSEYLCVRVSGFLERAVQQIFYEHALRTQDRALAKFVSTRLERETNYNAQRLADVVGQFDSDWQNQMETFLADDNRRNALDSIRANRNRIAHGESVSLGLAAMKDWYKRVADTIEHLESIVL